MRVRVWVFGSNSVHRVTPVVNVAKVCEEEG